MKTTKKQKCFYSQQQLIDAFLFGICRAVVESVEGSDNSNDGALELVPKLPKPRLEVSGKGELWIAGAEEIAKRAIFEANEVVRRAGFVAQLARDMGDVLLEDSLG